MTWAAAGMLDTLVVQIGFLVLVHVSDHSESLRIDQLTRDRFLHKIADLVKIDSENYHKQVVVVVVHAASAASNKKLLSPKNEIFHKRRGTIWYHLSIDDFLLFTHLQERSKFQFLI